MAPEKGVPVLITAAPAVQSSRSVQSCAPQRASPSVTRGQIACTAVAERRAKAGRRALTSARRKKRKEGRRYNAGADVSSRKGIVLCEEGADVSTTLPCEPQHHQGQFLCNSGFCIGSGPNPGVTCGPPYSRPPPSRVLTDARALIGHAAHTLFLVPPPPATPARQRGRGMLSLPGRCVSPWLCHGNFSRCDCSQGCVQTGSQASGSRHIFYFLLGLCVCFLFHRRGLACAQSAPLPRKTAARVSSIRPVYTVLVCDRKTASHPHSRPTHRQTDSPAPSFSFFLSLS